jgi:putative thioredoxin
MSVDVSEATFPELVLERSKQKPVVVDFWAPWCGPCRVLGPVLEKEVAALGDRVEMVKINTDENQGLAQAFNIQGIPAVKAFRDGQVVAEFVGARPAPFVKSWLAGLAPSAAVEALAGAATALREGRAADAEKALRGLVDNPETRDEARLRLARLLIGSGRASEASPLVAGIDPRSAASSSVEAIERLIALAGEKGDESAATPNDLEGRWTLATAAIARADFATALEHLLEIVSRNRKFKDDGARLAMLSIFDQLGGEDPLTQDFRRRLQIVL